VRPEATAAGQRFCVTADSCSFLSLNELTGFFFFFFFFFIYYYLWFLFTWRLAGPLLSRSNGMRSSPSTPPGAHALLPPSFLLLSSSPSVLSSTMRCVLTCCFGCVCVQDNDSVSRSHGDPCAAVSYLAYLLLETSVTPGPGAKPGLNRPAAVLAGVAFGVNTK